MEMSSASEKASLLRKRPMPATVTHSKGVPRPGCFSYTEAAQENSPGPMSQGVGAPLQKEQTKPGSFRANFCSS